MLMMQASIYILLKYMFAILHDGSDRALWDIS